MGLQQEMNVFTCYECCKAVHWKGTDVAASFSTAYLKSKLHYDDRMLYN